MPEKQDGYSNRQYASLEAALRSHKVTPDNQQFLRQLLVGVDVEGYFERGSYIKVSRREGGPALEIHRGYTNGFRSEDEITQGVGSAERWESGRGTGLWGVTHPDHGPFRGEWARRDIKRDGGLCPNCNDVLPMSGICNFCD